MCVLQMSQIQLQSTDPLASQTRVLRAGVLFFVFLSGVALAKTDVRQKAADKFNSPASRGVVDSQ